MNVKRGRKPSKRGITAAPAAAQSVERFPPILTIRQAAELLQVPVNTLRSWRTRGRLLACARCVGKRVLLHRDRLLEWFFNGSVRAVAGSEPMKVPAPAIKSLEYRLYLRRGLWQISVRGLGRQVRKSLKTRDEAAANERAAAFVDGIRPPSASAANDPMPVSIAATIAAYLSYAQDIRLAPRTIAKYRWTMRKVEELARDRGVRDITAINLAFLDAYRHKRNEAGVAAKTLFNEVISIKQLVNFAVSRELIPSNPLKTVRMRKPKSRPQPFWTIDQVKAILAASAKSSYYNVLLLLAHTGMRISEVKFLTWLDVDFEHKLLFVREKQIGPKATDVWKPKNGQQRVVPLSTDVLEMLGRAPKDCKWVFGRPPKAGHKIRNLQFNEREVLMQLKAILKRLGLEGHVHTFRHSFVSHAVVRGVPEAVIRDWVGHVDPAMIRHYTHIAVAASRQQMDHLFESVPGSKSQTPGAPPKSAGLKAKSRKPARQKRPSPAQPSGA